MRLFEAVSGFALQHLTEKRFLALRELYHSGRIKLYPLMKAVYGTFGAEDLCAHLQQRIGTDFEILMVHSSVNHMQPLFTDNPLDLVRMLMSFCGPDRTLAMPAFYFGDPALGGAYATFQQRPRFDLKRTPSMMGLATELFRRSKGVVQSRHPVYRVSALGPLAAELTRGHEHAPTPSGSGTPFDFMASRDTLILGIGKPYEVMTQIHHAEAVMGEEFPVPAETGKPLPMTLVDGGEEIPFVLSGRRLKWRLNMWKLRDIMPRDQLHEWTFHHVPLFAARAAHVTGALTAAAKRGVTLYESP